MINLNRVGAATFLLALAACRQVGPAFGPNIPLAKQNADEFFYSVGSRFTNIQRPPRIIHARAQFGHFALTPSGVARSVSIVNNLPRAAVVRGKLVV